MASLHLSKLDKCVSIPLRCQRPDITVCSYKAYDESHVANSELVLLLDIVVIVVLEHRRNHPSRTFSFHNEKESINNEKRKYTTLMLGYICLVSHRGQNGTTI